ncbi:hypothetical protein ERJ75_000894600 [Trypanosoma vivax]|nr:hypothetical protein ERJ75_000894600 [Trypanosoma vivax]
MSKFCVGLPFLPAQCCAHAAVAPRAATASCTLRTRPGLFGRLFVVPVAHFRTQVAVCAAHVLPVFFRGAGARAHDREVENSSFRGCSSAVHRQAPGAVRLALRLDQTRKRNWRRATDAGAATQPRQRVRCRTLWRDLRALRASARAAGGAGEGESRVCRVRVADAVRRA